MTQTVQPATASIYLGPGSYNTSTVGQSVTFTASYMGSSGLPLTGAILFKDNGVTVGSASVSGQTGGQVSYTTAALSVGTHIITAEYDGNASYALSTSNAVTQQVQPAWTSTGLSSSATWSALGQPVTFTAQVDSMSMGVAPGGYVTFKDGDTVLAVVAVTPDTMGAQAVFTTSTLTGGAHTITAGYSGDLDDLGSSASLTETIQ